MTSFTATRVSDDTAVALLGTIDEHLVLVSSEITRLVRELMDRSVVSFQGSVNNCPTMVEVSEPYPVPGDSRRPGLSFNTFVRVSQIGEAVTGMPLDFDVKRERLKVLVDEATALETARAALKKR
jgi:hypothetical protein